MSRPCTSQPGSGSSWSIASQSSQPRSAPAVQAPPSWAAAAASWRGWARTRGAQCPPSSPRQRPAARGRQTAGRWGARRVMSGPRCSAAPAALESWLGGRWRPAVAQGAPPQPWRPHPRLPSPAHLGGLLLQALLLRQPVQRALALARHGLQGATTEGGEQAGLAGGYPCGLLHSCAQPCATQASCPASLQ